MLYYLFDWLDKVYQVPGAGVFQYISFRAACCFMTSLLIVICFGNKFIRFIKRKGIGENVRAPEQKKANTPTMGGLLIIAAIIIPTLLFTKLDNIYILIMIGTTIWIGCVGFIDDYIKVFKHNKDGLSGKYKVIAQSILGVVVGLLAVFHPEISSTTTTIPFVKNHELDYTMLISWMGDWAADWAWIVYVIVAVLVVVAVSNASNLTDGIDGLAATTGSIIGGALAILAWLSGNLIMSKYLNIVYLENIGELTMFISSFVGALLGFYWYNGKPASMFMGDTGSLTIGAIIAVYALLIRKELLLPLLCGIYVVENLSVIIQREHCKYYRKKHKLPIGVDVPKEKRIFFCTPLHHHYQKGYRTDGKGLEETKVVQRFAIVSIMLAILTILTLKIR